MAHVDIVIDTVPHEHQRYETVGDWWIAPDGKWRIRVSRMEDWRHVVCVAIHELVEMALCQQDGVSQTLVDQFDQVYEESRAEGDTSEPGDDPAAPYYKQHGIASGIERIVATALGVDWNKYNDEVNAL